MRARNDRVHGDALNAHVDAARSQPGARDIRPAPPQCQLSARTPAKSVETGDRRRRGEGADLADTQG
jgi:hypothetical protein